MQTKDRVLILLKKQKNEYMSGEEIASTLNISRTAVWKAINSLKMSSYQIEAVTNRGYRLLDGPDILNCAIIKSMLKKDVEIEYLDSVDSTNEYAKIESSKLNKDKIYVANYQTKGKGRKGRTFISPKNTGVYISFLVHPKMPAQEAVMLTTLAAAATALAIEKLAEKRVGIKWVNDLIIESKKIAGILTEGSISMENGELNYAIVGIGINVYHPNKGFPEEIKDVAGSIFGKEKGNSDFRNRLVAEIANNFFEFYENLGKKEYLEVYRERSIVIGKNIKVLSNDEEIRAKALEIDSNANLVVEYQDGKIEKLNSGEISITL